MRFSVHHAHALRVRPALGPFDPRRAADAQAGERPAPRVVAHRRTGQALGLDSTATATRSRPSRWRSSTTRSRSWCTASTNTAAPTSGCAMPRRRRCRRPFWLRNTGLARHDASFDPLIEGLAERRRRADAARRRPARAAWSASASASPTRPASRPSTPPPLEALARGAGVAQDQAHVFIAACRRLGVPARYVSGYLRNDDPELHVGRTSHSWAEAWVPGLEWVGFDPGQRHQPARRQPAGRRRPRLSRCRPGQRPARRLRRCQDDRRGGDQVGRLTTLNARYGRRALGMASARK